MEFYVKIAWDKSCMTLTWKEIVSVFSWNASSCGNAFSPGARQWGRQGQANVQAYLQATTVQVDLQMAALGQQSQGTLQAARASGWQGLVYTGFPDLCHELTKRGVQIAGA